MKPKKISDIIGQKQVVEPLKICIDSAIKKNLPFPHSLFEGPPGLGKSTLAKIISNEINTNCTNINGATITNQASLINALIKAQDKDIIFIDEIHSLPQKIEELLYMPLQDNKLLITASKTNQFKPIEIPLKNFTFLAATTHIGKVSKPLVDRINLKFYLDFYSEKEIYSIIESYIKNEEFKITNKGITYLSKQCKDTPRIAISYIKWLSNYCSSKNKSIINEEDVEKAMNIYGVDSNGYDKNDKLYLKILSETNEPLGLKTIASLTSIPEKTILDCIEPYLIRKNIITKTKSGRILTSNVLTSFF